MSNQEVWAARCHDSRDHDIISYVIFIDLLFQMTHDSESLCLFD